MALNNLVSLLDFKVCTKRCIDSLQHIVEITRLTKQRIYVDVTRARLFFKQSIEILLWTRIVKFSRSFGPIVREISISTLTFMVDLDQTERVDRELKVVKRARFNQTIKEDKSNEVSETKFGVEPQTVKATCVACRERHQDNMFLHQQQQDNMLDEEVVGFGQRPRHQQDQQQLQLGQHTS